MNKCKKKKTREMERRGAGWPWIFDGIEKHEGEQVGHRDLTQGENEI